MSIKTKKSYFFRLSAIFLAAMLLFNNNSFFAINNLVSADEGLSQSEKAKKEYEEKRAEAEEYKAKLEKKKKKTEKRLAELEKEKSDLETYIQQLDLEMTEVVDELFALADEIDVTQEELEVTRKNLEEAIETQNNQYSNMKNRIRYIYENGEPSIFEVILSSENISDILNNAEYALRIAEYDNDLLDRYIEAKEQVELEKSTLETTIEQLETMKETAIFHQESLEVLRIAKNEEVEKYLLDIEETDDLLSGVGEQIDLTAEEIAKLDEAERKRLEEEERRRKEEEERKRKEEEERKRREEEARRKATDKNTIGKVVSTYGYDADAIKSVKLSDESDPSNMIWPLPGDLRTFSRFGYRERPLPGATSYHKGWDIGGELGAPIVCTVAGTAHVGYNSSAGNYVRVVHEGGIETYYCHCYKILISEGQSVKQGETLALVGSTGVSTAPHLHFAIKKNGEYIDPAPYIAHFVD